MAPTVGVESLAVHLLLCQGAVSVNTEGVLSCHWAETVVNGGAKAPSLESSSWCSMRTADSSQRGKQQPPELSAAYPEASRKQCELQGAFYFSIPLITLKVGSHFDDLKE